MAYKFYDDVAIADVAYEATGKTLAEMMESAGLALTNTMVKDIKAVKTPEEVVFELKADKADKLLHEFLQELIFYKDKDLVLLTKFKIRITSLATGYRAQIRARGDKINMKKQELLVDVKAVSWHMFKVEQTRDGWRAFVILYV